MHRVRKLMKLGSYRYVQITNDGDSNKIPEQWWKCSSVAVKFWLIFFMLGGYLFYQDYFEIRALAMRHLVRLSEEPQLPDELSSLNGYLINTPGDPDYHQLFKELNETGSLNNTVLIFMSDHGIRWGDIRKTYQGQMEERLPFVIMKFPEWFKQTYPAAVGNFIKNTRRLTTPFDLHETLKQLLDVDQLLNVRKIMNEKSRGYSLFDEIPKQRTCEDAEIVSHWCTCQQSVAIETDNKIVVSAAKFAVDHINSQLKGYGDCAILDLANITQARVLTYDAEHITSKESVKDYTITLNTTPGDAIFEVTVRQKEGTGNVAPGNFSVTGSISRLNLYGKQSYCITDFHLKLYCYCKSLLKS
ncbi:uncharacterized protein LOC126743706 isoform X4 [Anthonomus grandis grandis]|uniref:uncharacterized protein LOC126743706 isoform X3 n=1 Tax=Anthonomus grandis grandis TaxID=2921223 RepID=UPI00216619DB|nr:uncharacterized protein LOC126743706 isoform X3 [Anthonomus grandis grandis]XP_050306879.1 uncharacterized protein LOC126743706 isoform X4 [Anthonomus grandis grandis]